MELENLKHISLINVLSCAKSEKFDKDTKKSVNDLTKDGRQVYSLAIKTKVKTKINDIEYEKEDIVRLKSLVAIDKPGNYQVSLEQFIMPDENNPKKKPMIIYRVLEVLSPTPANTKG